MGSQFLFNAGHRFFDFGSVGGLFLGSSLGIFGAGQRRLGFGQFGFGLVSGLRTGFFGGGLGFVYGFFRRGYGFGGLVDGFFTGRFQLFLQFCDLG